SLAINSGADCPDTDQLDQSRVGICDRGAVEFAPPAPPPLQPDINSIGSFGLKLRLTNGTLGPCKGVQVLNQGEGNLNITNPAIAGPNAVNFALCRPPKLPLILAPGTSVLLKVRCVSPDGLSTGSRSGRLEITSNDPDEGLYKIPATCKI